MAQTRLMMERELSQRRGLEVSPTRVERLGICQLIDGSMIKGLPAASGGGY